MRFLEWLRPRPPWASLQGWHERHEAAALEGCEPDEAVRRADDVLDGHTWLCEGCGLETRSALEAGLHAEGTTHWVWLFPDDREEGTSALRECHGSDVPGVWYDSPAPWRHTWHEHWTAKTR